MARGDVVAQIVSLDNAAAHTVQPGSGVEWVIKTVGLGAHAAVYLFAYDGTLTTTITTGAKYAENLALTLPINNSDYISLHNASGGTMEVAYYGYITKE